MDLTAEEAKLLVEKLCSPDTPEKERVEALSDILDNVDNG